MDYSGVFSLHTSEPNQIGTKVCSKKKKEFISEEVAHTKDTGELMLKDMASRGWIILRGGGISHGD